MSGDAAQHIGKPGLGINVVHLSRHDQAIHGRGALTAAVGAGEQPRFAAKSDTALNTVGRSRDKRSLVENAIQSRKHLRDKIVAEQWCQVAERREDEAVIAVSAQLL
jgi:hypothetical protein